MIYDIVSKLVSVLGSRKTTPLGPYLYHLYGKAGCLKVEELETLRAARDCIELDVTDDEPEDEPEGSDRGSLSPEGKLVTAETPTRLRMKTSFRAPKGKEPMRSPDLKDLSFLNLDDEPFARLQVELDQVQCRYVKLETVVKGAARLLGDCKAENIGKEIRRLKAEDSANWKAQVEKLQIRIGEQQAMMKEQEDQIAKLKADWSGFQRIRLITEINGDVAAKAHLFEEAMKMDGPMSHQKSVMILSKYAGRIETALTEMRKIWPGHGSKQTGPSGSVPSAPSPSAVPVSKPSAPSPASKVIAPPPPPHSPTASAFEALKGRIQERREREALATTAAASPQVSPATVSPVMVPAVVPVSKGKGKVTDSREDSSGEITDRRKKKTQALPVEEERESSSSVEEEEGDEEEGEETSTPSPEPPATRARSGKQKTSPSAKPSSDRKRKPPAKSPKKDGSSTKKGRKK